MKCVYDANISFKVVYDPTPHVACARHTRLHPPSRQLPPSRPIPPRPGGTWLRPSSPSPIMTSTPAELSALLNSSFLKCPLCCDVYQCPILLPCLHCMCAGCFEAYVEKFTVCDPNKPDMERGQRPTFDCPVCKAGWPLPSKDQSVAPSNSFLVSRLLFEVLA